jgi:hypothetical protein
MDVPGFTTLIYNGSLQGLLRGMSVAILIVWHDGYHNRHTTRDAARRVTI